jgi:hypothetical protein
MPGNHPEPEAVEVRATFSPLLKNRKIPDNAPQGFQLRRDETLQALLDQLRGVFVFWGRTTLSYEYINEYIYCQQLRILNKQTIDEDYMDTGEKRVRIDENLKLCIMPLAYSGSDENLRVRDLAFRAN